VAMPLEVPEHEGWVEADLDRLPDDGIRYELIDGSLQRKPADVALAVKIESRGSRRDDRRIKPEVYAEAGIPSYWRVERHPEGPHLHAYKLVDGVYAHVAWIRPGVAWQATAQYPVVPEPGAWVT